MRKKYIILFICICLFSLFTGLFIGFYLGDNLYTNIIHPFKNTAGLFDYSIFWTAILGLATITLSILITINSAKYQKQNEKNTIRHQTQIENLTKLNLELTDKLVHIETFKYFPQIKFSLTKETSVQLEEHIHLYCGTRDLYNNNITPAGQTRNIFIVCCQLENLGASYIDEIKFIELAIIVSDNNESRIAYRGKPQNTGCSSIFVNSNKKLIISFLKTYLKVDDNFIHIISHYVIKNGKEQLWETNWMNHIYIKITEDKNLKPLHCTSTRLNTVNSFNEQVKRIVLEN